MSEAQRAYVLGPDDGDAFWFVGALMVKKAAAPETGNAFSFLDQIVPGGYAAPRHVHRNEDEAWYILEGEVTFYCGDRTFDAWRGAFVYLPKAVEHAFKVGSDDARLLTLTAPASFADFVIAAISKGCNTCPSATASASPTATSSLRWEATEIPTTMPWPRR